MRSLGLLVVSSLTVATLAALACGTSVDSPSTTSGAVPTGEGGAPLPIRSEFGLDARPANPTCRAPQRPANTAPIKFERVFNDAGLQLPMMMTQPPGDGAKWFVAQRGTANGGVANIVSFEAAHPAATKKTVATIGPLGAMESEGGLLGLAFHPKYPTVPRLYITWVRQGGPQGRQSEVGYLTTTDGGNTFTDYTPILGPFDQPAANHNGGGIAFGKDGFLYLSFGDGGGGDDAFNHGQEKSSFFSKVLRIDVDNIPGGQKYGIPDGNPFKAGGGEPATFAYGFRNPFRISIDRESNEVWVADVGQNKWEEVDPKVRVGGNYGWPCREGRHDYLIDNNTKCPTKTGFTDPAIEHEHVPSNSRSITGGVVYRGKAIPAFVGSYVYGDYVRAETFVLSYDPGTGEAKSAKLEDAPAGKWVSFAEDLDGEVYGVSLDDGAIYKVVSAPSTEGPSTFPDRLSKTGCVDPTSPSKVAAGLIPYGVNSPLWSDGATKERFMALPDDQRITIAEDGDFDFPNGTVLMKVFTIGGKKIETRLFVRHEDGAWAGYTYEWLDDQTDAIFLPSSKSKRVGAQTWAYPSRSDCVNCHSEAAGRSLGLELGQLNGDFTYANTNRISNQLKTLDHIGVFTAPLGKPVDQVIAFPDPKGTTGTLEERARSYLHSNCSNCHRPDGPGRGKMDLRFGSTFQETNTCDADGEAGDIGVAGAKLIVPGTPSKSLVSLRSHSPAANRMPPLASSVVDDQGVTLLDEWIASITACP